MFPSVDMMQCQNLAVPLDVLEHVVQLESSFNPYAIGVVGGRLVRQPQSLAEAVATAEMLEERGYNFSVGLAQVNRYNLQGYGLNSYSQAFDGCTNLRAGSQILSECHVRAKGDWGKAFSCYYSGNFTTGYQHGYVQKIFASMAGRGVGSDAGRAIRLSTDDGQLDGSPVVGMIPERRIPSAGGASENLVVSASPPQENRLDEPSGAAVGAAGSRLQAVDSRSDPAVGGTAAGDSVVQLQAARGAASPSKQAAAVDNPQVAEVAVPGDTQDSGDKAFVF
jgi:type IV secretion system protein VirB1